MDASRTCPSCSAAMAPEDTACPRCGAGAPAAPVFEAGEPPPDLPPRYEIRLQLGRGGMGRVFLCRDSVLEVDVAVKVLRPEIAADEKKVQRIESEAKVAARLRGLPGILGLYGFEHHGVTRFLVMEYAAGGSVHQRIRDQGKIPEPGCRRIGAEIAEALVSAHSRGVLHRDIKPANVLLDIAGKARVTDFGLAHIVDKAYGGSTQVAREGTPSYMSPEAFGDRGVDGRSDLYALGALLYEMATGIAPYKGTPAAIAQAKTAPGAAAPDPSTLQPKLSPEFVGIVRRLLDPDPERRFPNAASTAEALRGATVGETGPPVLTPVSARGRGAPVAAIPVQAPARAAKPSRVPWVVGLAVAGAAAVAGVFVLGGGRGETPAAPGTGPGVAAPGPAPEAKVAPIDVLTVVTRPAGARVTVDGNPIGRTESEAGLRVPGLAFGVPHVVSAALEDYETDEERNVVLEKGKARAPVVLRLVPKSGILEMDCGEPGARAIFRREGKVAREAAFRDDGTLAPESMPAGEYEVEVVAKGWQTWKRVVRVSAGANPKVRVALDAKPGILCVDTDPTGAKVLVDGTEVGRTPLRDYALRPGTRTVVFEHPDAAGETQEARVRSDEKTDMGTVKLPPLATVSLEGLPADVSVIVEGTTITGAIRRSPGPVMVTFRRAGCSDQGIPMELKSGPNPLPPLGEWTRAPGKLDFSGLGQSAELVLCGGVWMRQPWTVLDAAPGVYHVVFAKAGLPTESLRVAVRSGESAKIPAPLFAPRAPSKPATPFRPFQAAVDAGSDWIVRHQGTTGQWDCDGFAKRCKGAACRGPGGGVFDTGVTGLAVLALLDRRNLAGECDGLAALRGLESLVTSQQRDGDYAGLYGEARSNHFSYNHAIATLAVLEGYRATGSPTFAASAQRAVDFIEKCRNPRLAWRYGIRPKDSDTSVTSWMVDALASARELGLDVEQTAFDGALAWIDSVTDVENGRAGYTALGNGPARPEEVMDKYPMECSESLAAAGVLIRLACGRPPDDPLVQKALLLCAKLPPEWDRAKGTIDYYYWYLGTRAIFDSAPAEIPVAGTGDSRLSWLRKLESACVKPQKADRGECSCGSWDLHDPWGTDGGRVYATAMNMLAMLAPVRRVPALPDRPETTVLSLATTPPGALVELDGRFMGSTPVAKLAVPAGRFALRVSHPERADYTAEVDLVPFRENDLGTIPLPAGATIDLSELPRDASAVAFGRELKGRGSVRPGEVRGFLQRPGHFPQPFALEAKTGETAKPAAGPWRPAPEWGKVLLTGLPPPPAAVLDGIALPADVVVHEGRIWSTRDRAEMVLVPAIPAEGKDPAAPAFLIDRHEVSVAQVQLFCKSMGSRIPAQPRGSSPRHPAVNLGPEWASAYAKWACKRLPTAEEWQRAAVGRPVAALKPPIPYPWGTWDAPQARNTIGTDDGAEGFSPVGSFPLGMSACGVLDLVGNVAERLDGGRVTGSSYLTHRRETYGVRTALAPEPDVGFRCVLDLGAPK